MDALLKWAEGQVRTDGDSGMLGPSGMSRPVHFAQGAKVRKLEISASNQREFVAADDISPGDTIISLPQDLLLHADVAIQDAEYGEAFRRLQEDLGATVDQRHMLCLLLILERARTSASRWSHYVDILPKTYDDPYWWSAEELQVVSGTRLSRAIEQYRPGIHAMASWAAKVEELFMLLNPGNTPGVLSTYQDGWAFTLDAARWARSTVWSRSFTVHELCGKSSVVALVPVLDMIDHSPEVEVVWHTGPGGTEHFQFSPLTAVPKGSVLSNNYGCKTNDELLLAYGFAIPANPADYFHVSLARAQASHAAAHAAAAHEASKSAHHVSISNGMAASARITPTSDRRAKATDWPNAQSMSEDDGEPASELQIHAEELQREAAMLLLGLTRSHQLTVMEPVPQHLVHSSSVCLMPPPELYQLNAWLLQLVRGQQQGVAEEEQRQPDRAAAAEAPGGPGEAAQAKACKSRGTKRPASEDEPAPSSVRAADSLPGSAMHVVPRRWDQPALPQASAAHDAPAAHMATRLLGGMDSKSAWAEAAAVTGNGEVAEATSAARLAAARQLPVLVSLQQQLEAKLRGMVSEQQTRSLLNIPASVPQLFPDTTSSTGLKGLAASPDVSQVVTGHGGLALTYVQGQRSILQGALNALRSQVGQIIQGMSRHVLPPAQMESPLSSTALEVVQSTSACSKRLHSPPVGQNGFCNVPAVFTVSAAQHMSNYTQWLAAAVASPASLSADSADAGVACSSGMALCEVLCRPRREAVAAAAAASKAAAAASASGSRGRRRPLASVTLRSLRNMGSSGSRVGAAADHGEAVAQPRQSDDGSKPQAAPPSLPAGISASLGLDMVLAYEPLAWGAMTMTELQPGDVVLQVPLECAMVAGSKEELLQALMITAHALLQELVAYAAGQRHNSTTGATSTELPSEEASQPGTEAAAAPQRLQPRQMLVLHLMHVVGALPASRLPASESEQVSMLMEMLEDSPVGMSCHESFDTLKAEYQALNEACSCRSDGPANHKMLRKVLAWPGAFGLFCWAGSVVERCATRVLAPPGSPPGSSATWAVLPVVSAVPELLRDAVLQVELVAEGQGSSHLRCMATCGMPPGLLLSPALMLPYSNVDSLMSVYGPESLAWRRLICRQAQAQQKPAAEPASSSALAGTPFDRPAVERDSLRAAGPRVLYELFISPSEADPLYQEKMELLSAAGLGCVHYLTEGLETEALVFSALKICVADEELLMHPLVHQVMQLNEAIDMFKQQSQAEPEPMHPTTMAAAGTASVGAMRPQASQTAGVAGHGAEVGQGSAAEPTDPTSPLMDALGRAPHSSGTVPRGFMQLVQQAQQMLISMLESLPADHEVSMAALKQLRHIVHDARKHTKRRLRQMDTQEEQKAGGGSFWNAGGHAAMHQRQQQQQQLGLDVLGQGVHLYLEELVLVLDAWADHLGLEPAKLEKPLSKRPKLRHAA